MGSACCVAAKDHTHPNRSGVESQHRDVVCSLSWSFRLDRRGRVAGEIENNLCHTSDGVSRNISMELKGSISSERGNLSDGGSTLENSVTPISQKSPVHEALGANLMTPSSDLSLASNYSTVVKNPASPEIAESSALNLPFSMPLCFSTPTTDPLPNHNYHHLRNSTPSRWSRHSPGHPLLRQISDSRILGLKSPDNSISEGRPSFVLSTCSNDIAESQCGSSDGWSMRTFSELVASSQRERWSFDSEYLGSGRHKISGSSGRFSYSPSMDLLQSCGACSKLLSERSAWSNQKFTASSDVSVVAVLVCGHVYHAECLETMTPEADRYDPACPICMAGEKHWSKFSRKGLRAESEMKEKSHRISKNRVVDSYVGVFSRRRDVEWGGEVPKMEPNSHARSSFGKPFLRRHFSLRSKWSRSLSDNDCVKKKGFWARYRKD